MARVVHFDISGNNPEQLIPFYRNIFHWKFSKWEGPMEYWMIETGPDDQAGINGGLGKRQSDDRVVNTIGIEDIDSTLEQVRNSGGTVITDKAAFPGVGWFAQFKDPEGNVFGLMQDDPSAKQKTNLPRARLQGLNYNTTLCSRMGMAALATSGYCGDYKREVQLLERVPIDVAAHGVPSAICELKAQGETRLTTLNKAAPCVGR